jgi:hypothetical protein
MANLIREIPPRKTQHRARRAPQCEIDRPDRKEIGTWCPGVLLRRLGLFFS